MRQRTSLRTAAAAAAAAAVTLLAATPGFAHAGTGAATVTVRADQSVGTVAAGAVGVNTPIWNGSLLAGPTNRLVHEAGIGTLEFNGGGVSDLYHWRDGSLSRDPDAANHPYDYFDLKPKFSFDQFEHIASAVGAGTLVHVNYGTGTPAEAAGWVRYANQVKHYGVRDWAVGEEVWGNGGIDGINFEPDAHPDRSPAAYAHNVVVFAHAMKAVDPTIRVGVEITGVAGGPLQDWDATVLGIAGPAVDFVDFHYYPFTAPDPSDAALLKLPRQVPANMPILRQLVDANAGRPAHHIDLVAGETNSAMAQTTQQTSMFNALYLADDNLSLLENGVRTVDWWALYNGGTASSGDLGLLSSGGCTDAGTDCEPPVGTPFPAYFGLRLFAAVARSGARLTPVSSSDPLVVAHAAREADGTVAVLLANEDPTQSHQVRLDLRGYHADRVGTELRYGQGDTAIHSGHSGDIAGVRALAPYSLTLLLLRPAR